MSYPGNYVADHSFGGDPCCPNYKEEDLYDYEKPDICALCGELIEIGIGKEIAGERVCVDCFDSAEETLAEKERMIKKFKR